MPTLLQLTLTLALLATSALTYQPLSDDLLKSISAADDDFDIESGALLAPILIPRIPGTEGQTKVQQHFVDFFTSHLPDWELSWQNSTSKTPATGDDDVPFQNIIVRRTPPWMDPERTSYFTLVAHYDSKLEPKGFIGATDSAAPCAMIMQIARAIDGKLTKLYEKLSAGDDADRTDVGVQILLLDGEEAFVSWTPTDSIYGSRSLAETWETTFNPAMSGYKNPLDQISVFVLLDLLGSASPRVPSHFQETHWAYQKLAEVEARMRDLGVLETEPEDNFLPEGDKESKDVGPSGIGDDHVPFILRGVPILHMIPSPFPTVWHKIEDDAEHLDMPTVRDWTRIFTAFTMEWLDLMQSDSVATVDGAQVNGDKGGKGDDGGGGDGEVKEHGDGGS